MVIGAIDWLQSIWYAIGWFCNLVIETMAAQVGWFWGKTIGYLVDIVTKVFDSDKLLEWGQKFLHNFWDVLYSHFPQQLKDVFDGLGDFYQSGVIQALLRFMSWLFSFVVSPSLLLTCISFILTVWFGAMCIKSVMWVKGNIWQTPA